MTARTWDENKQGANWLPGGAIERCRTHCYAPRNG
jgi:hypothetical protein